jgi:hypothetical protein
LCFSSAPIAELARDESRRPRLHGLRVEAGARHRLAARLALLAGVLGSAGIMGLRETLKTMEAEAGAR